MPIEESSSDNDLPDVFVFQKETELSNGLPPPPPPPQSSSASNGLYKPKHSFDQLVSDGTGPLSLIADEKFWQSVHSDAALGLGDHEREEGERGEEGEALSEMESLQCKADHSVPFLVENFDGVISQTVAQDSLIKVIWILLESDHGNIALPPPSLTLPIVKVCDAWNMLSEGVLFDLCEVDNFNHNLPVIIQCLVTLLREYRTDDGAIGNEHIIATFRLFTRIIEMTQNNPMQAEKLLETWSLSQYLSEVGSKNMATCRQLLDLHARILNVCSCWLAKDRIRDAFLQVVSLSLDHTIYEGCWRELHGIFSAIITWLDVPRIHLIIEWLGEGEIGHLLLAHHNRPVSIARLLNGSSLGQLAAKIILDLAIFPQTNDRGDDYDFIIALTSILQDVPIRSLTSAILLELQPKIHMAQYRLSLTLFTTEFYNDCRRLHTAIEMVYHAIPIRAHGIFVSLRDALYQMKSYIYAFILLRKRANRSLLRQV